LPVFDVAGSLIAVFDVDSEEYRSFDETDQKWLERILNKVFTAESDVHG
jgi:L-methionine (R)-S-oxide reductase